MLFRSALLPLRSMMLWAVVLLLALVFGGPGGCPTQTRADCTGCSDGAPPARKVLSVPGRCPVMVEITVGDRTLWGCPDEEIMIRTPSVPSIMVPEADMCIFASDVRNGVYRWRRCPDLGLGAD
jgi:hypothetical protein